MIGRLSQVQREALERQDGRYVPLPLPAHPDTNAVGAHLRHAARLLKDRQVPSPSARAVSHINVLYDRSIPEAAKNVLACRQGCAHCCHQQVVVYAPELFFLAGQIRGRDGIAEKLQQETETASTKCPLLEGDACSVYAARPLSCHSFVSLDVNDCISTFRYLNPPSIRTPQIHNDLRNYCRMILLAAMQGIGLPVHAYELNNSTLVAILALDHAEKRWLRGEDVLAGLKIIPADIPDNIQGQINQMAANVQASL